MRNKGKRSKSDKSKLKKYPLGTLEAGIREKGLRGYAKNIGMHEDTLKKFYRVLKRKVKIATIILFSSLALLPLYMILGASIISGELNIEFLTNTSLLSSYILCIFVYQKTLFIKKGKKITKYLYNLSTLLIWIILVSLYSIYRTEKGLLMLSGIILFFSIINYLVLEIGLTTFKSFEFEKKYKVEEFPVIGIKVYLKALKWISFPFILSIFLTGLIFLIFRYKGSIVSHVTILSLCLAMSILIKDRVDRQREVGD